MYVFQIASELRENGWMFGEFYLDIDANSFKILPTGKGIRKAVLSFQFCMFEQILMGQSTIQEHTHAHTREV